MKKISRLENNKNGEKKNKNKKNRDNELKRKCKQKSMQWLVRSIHQDLPMLINVKFHYLSLDFIQELYKEGVRFNIYEYAAQKILKFEKIRK